MQDNETNDTDEAWVLNELASIEDLKTENSPSCDSEGCNDKASYAYQGQVAKSRWNSCINCQLKDYADWPSIGEFKDALEDVPLTIEMEQIVRKERMDDSNMALPSCLSRSRLDNPLVAVELNETPHQMKQMMLPTLMMQVKALNPTVWQLLLLPKKI